MEKELLFKNESELSATERVLAHLKVKNLNENTDKLVEEILTYAKELDDILEQNGLERTYLDKVSNLTDNTEISIDPNYIELDYKVIEIIEDYIKRINTRLSMIKESDKVVNDLEEKYNLYEIDLDTEIRNANIE